MRSILEKLKGMRRKPIAAELLGCAAALLVLIGSIATSGRLRQMLYEADQTRRYISNDDDFYMAGSVLGRDYLLFDGIRRGLPTGTRVAIADCPNTKYKLPTLGRRQRFWLALLPDYPIGPSQFLLCPPDQVTGSDKVIGRGDLFVLVRRSPGETGQ